MKAFGSVEKLSHATEEDIATAVGLSKTLAKRILTHLKK
jgi:excinuclease UvrABC nuclease subunit